jgi:hypothetical protein
MHKIFWISGALLLAGGKTMAQVMDHATMDHSAAMAGPPAATSPSVPTEAGQSAYAAIGEVARIMLANPNTDWSHADVDALRNHLVDMDNVTMRSEVTETKLANGALFHVTGEGPVIGSIQRMTQSHFAEPDVGKQWTMTVRPVPTGADVTVVSANPADAAEIVGLGFFGILTMGAHHQPHHLMMAEGLMKH